MAERSITYREIVNQQLEDALFLYFEKSDYISAITLAGASEEILGRMARHIAGKNALREYVDLYLDLNEIFKRSDLAEKDIIDLSNHARNKMKHLDDPKVAGLILDDKEAAEEILNRAIDNFRVVFQELSPMMKCFKDAMYNVV